MNGKRVFVESSEHAELDEIELAPCTKWNRDAADDASVQFDLAFLVGRCVAHLADVRRSFRPRTLDALRSYILMHRLHVLVTECSSGVMLDFLATLGAIFLNEDGSVGLGDAQTVAARHQAHVALNCLPAHWTGEHRAYDATSDAFAEIAQQVLAAMFADGAPAAFASLHDFRALLTPLCTLERAFDVDQVIAALGEHGVVLATAGGHFKLQMPSRCIQWANPQNYLN